MKTNTLVILDRDWASYSKGDLFRVVEAVKCGEVAQADGSTINPTNLRVVFDGQALDNPANHRTIPAEYAVQMVVVGQRYDVEANQGMRDGTVVAVIGSEFLVEYHMPNGKTYGRLLDLFKSEWDYRAVPMHNLPKKWNKAVFNG